MDARQRGELLEKFKKYVVAHPNLLESVSTVKSYILEPAGAAITLLYGPTGVGKTLLIEAILAEVNEALAPELAADPGRFGVVAFDAPAPTGPAFSWKQFFMELLKALGEPVADPRLERAGRSVGQRLRSGEEARWQAENALAQRRPKAVLVDEAPHIANLASGVRLLNHADLLKSLADRTGTHFVLVGTYDLLAFRNLSAQLGRRTRDVHFPRYTENEEDMRTFRTVLRSFARALPIDAVDLIAHTDFLYERSSGCVGTLRDWLVRALAGALEFEEPFLSTELLHAHALPMKTATSAAEEIAVGEAKLVDTEHDRLRLRELLGMSPQDGVATIERSAQSERPRAAGRVGKRKPNRDPIGVEV